MQGFLVWQRTETMRVGLGRQLKFPEETAVTSLRPDIVLWSKQNKTGGLDRTDGTLGGEDRGGTRAQVGEVSASHCREPAEGVESTSGGRLQGVPRTVTLESAGDAWG